MKRALLLVAIGTVVTSGARSATADPTRGPFQVMGPDGTVVRISSEAAEAWWADYRKSKCVTCRGPHQAAELLTAVENGLGGRFNGGPRYLILVEALRSSWPRAWVFYPSSDETPAYVMKPGGVGSAVAPLGWDAWQRATSRMERVILLRVPGVGPVAERQEPDVLHRGRLASAASATADRVPQVGDAVATDDERWVMEQDRRALELLEVVVSDPIRQPLAPWSVSAEDWTMSSAPASETRRAAPVRHVHAAASTEEP